LTATGKIGRGALGTDAREIAVPELKALSFTPGNMITNGRLELVDERGKSVLHFRRKGNDRWHSLFDQLIKLAPAGADQVPTGDAPLFSEDSQASTAAMEAWFERKRAKAEAKRAAKQ
jgi:hypothetical protein